MSLKLGVSQEAQAEAPSVMPSRAWGWVERPRAPPHLPTFEEDDPVVTAALIHSIDAVQMQGKAPPEAVYLCWLQ